MNQDDTEVVEETTLDTAEEQAGQSNGEIAELKEQLAQQSNALSQLVAALKQPAIDQKKVDQGKLAELSKDPAAAANYIQSLIAEGKNEIVRESQKEIQDRKAEQDFPILKTDPKFRAEVLKQMNEFIKTGEYAPNSPMLTYRAAQIVAGKLGKTESKKQSSANFTSEAPATRSKTTTTQGQNKIPDNDPRVVMAKMLGIEGKRMEKFKSELDGPYVPKPRQKARSLVK